MKVGDLMGRELHKKGNRYAIYSNVIDDYTTPFLEKNLIRKIWFYDLVMNDIDKVDRFMQDVDCEFEDKLEIDKKE